MRRRERSETDYDFGFRDYASKRRVVKGLARVLFKITKDIVMALIILIWSGIVKLFTEVVKRSGGDKNTFRDYFTDLKDTYKKE